MTAQSRAWECALALIYDYADRLTNQQRIVCEIAAMAGPYRAQLFTIPLAVQIIGART